MHLKHVPCASLTSPYKLDGVVHTFASPYSPLHPFTSPYKLDGAMHGDHPDLEPTTPTVLLAVELALTLTPTPTLVLALALTRRRAHAYHLRPQSRVRGAPPHALTSCSSAACSSAACSEPCAHEHGG